MYQANRIQIDDRAIAMPARAGETLFIEGEPCSSILEIRRGIARAVDHTAEGDRQVMAFFFPGHVVGLPLARNHRFSLEAASNLLYVRHSSSNWLAGLTRSFEEADRFLGAVRREERAFIERGLTIGRLGALARMAAFLMSVVPHLNVSGKLMEFPMSQTDIASYLATSPETVCRSLRHLREMRIIAMPRKDRFILQDYARLAALAEHGHE